MEHSAYIYCDLFVIFVILWSGFTLRKLKNNLKKNESLILYKFIKAIDNIYSRPFFCSSVFKL